MSNRILITCPDTELAVLTGFKAEPGTSLAGLNRVKLQNCPACGNTHVWNGDEAYWAEDEPAPTFMAVVRSFFSKSKQA